MERMGARFYEGVGESLQRLKRAAEDRALQVETGKAIFRGSASIP